jgi:hypothetical protein
MSSVNLGYPIIDILHCQDMHMTVLVCRGNWQAQTSIAGSAVRGGLCEGFSHATHTQMGHIHTTSSCSLPFPITSLIGQKASNMVRALLSSPRGDERWFVHAIFLSIACRGISAHYCPSLKGLQLPSCGSFPRSLFSIDHETLVLSADVRQALCRHELHPKE